MSSVTDKEFYMDNSLIGKIQLLSERCIVGRDVLLLIDGYEGYGKSTIGKQVCYLAAHNLKRKFTVDHVFFDMDALITFASTTEKQVLLWDEAALGGLSKEWQNKSQIKLIKLLMIARKKNHFFVFIIPKFFRLKEELIDRAIGMIHVYAKNETDIGTFCYYKKSSLNGMYEAWKNKKRPYYNKFYNFNARFSDTTKKGLIDEEEYEQKKDKAIASLGVQTSKLEAKYKDKLKDFQYRLATLPAKYGTKEYLAKHFNISETQMRQWGEKFSDFSEPDSAVSQPISNIVPASTSINNIVAAQPRVMVAPIYNKETNNERENER